MAEPTPGPWEASGRDIVCRPLPNSRITVAVAKVAGSNNDEPDANARLIAAAPEYKAARDTLFDAIAHGDAAHQNWLRYAIDRHFSPADGTFRGEPA